MGYIQSYSRKAKKKQYVPTNSDGNAGVRATMNNMGLDNSKIGWKNGEVTYGNKSFKPAEVKDGVSYASVADIQGFVNDIYKSEGKNPVRVTDYVSPAGMGSISYSQNGIVSVGGEEIPILYMDGDRAVADEKDIDNAYKKLMQKTGLQTAEDIDADWKNNYKNRLDTAYGDMSGIKEWSYNPETDPVYQAYSDMYRREGERAYRDAAAKVASKKNNGGMTSAAQTLANRQLAYYLSMLTDKLPELAENSYERYKDDYRRKQDAYTLLAEEAEKDWNRRTSEQKLAREDYRQSLENERNRTESESKRLDSELERAENIRKASYEAQKNAWENAEKRGYFTEEEAKLWNIPKDKDGFYLTPNDIKINTDVQYFNEATKPQLAYKSDLNINELLEKYRMQKENDAVKAAQQRANTAYRLSQQLENSKKLAAYKESIKYK